MVSNKKVRIISYKYFKHAMLSINNVTFGGYQVVLQGCNSFVSDTQSLERQVIHQKWHRSTSCDDVEMQLHLERLIPFDVSSKGSLRQLDRIHAARKRHKSDQDRMSMQL